VVVGPRMHHTISMPAHSQIPSAKPAQKNGGKRVRGIILSWRPLGGWSVSASSLDRAGQDTPNEVSLHGEEDDQR